MAVRNLDAVLAANRFGLGVRPGEIALTASAPKRFLDKVTEALIDEAWVLWPMDTDVWSEQGSSAILTG